MEDRHKNQWIEFWNEVRKPSWLELWRMIKAQGDPILVYKDLTARYSEPHRFYHTLDHVAFCLDDFQRNRHKANDLNAMEMAIWFHDVVYDTKAEDNEEKSAQLALAVVKKALLPDEFGQRVASLILATKHDVLPEDADAQFLVDIDLSIFGESSKRFDEYEQKIRKEYEWVSEEKFAVERLAILQSFLPPQRPNIYLTSFFQKKYEVKARENLKKSIAKLQK